MPLMRSYYEEEHLPRKLEQYLDEIRPPVLNMESINAESSIEPSPVTSKKMSRLKTEENKRTNRINSIAKDL